MGVFLGSVSLCGLGVSTGTYKYHGRECRAACEANGEFVACFELEGSGGLGFDGLELCLGPLGEAGEVEELVDMLS